MRFQPFSWNHNLLQAFTLCYEKVFCGQRVPDQFVGKEVLQTYARQFAPLEARTDDDSQSRRHRRCITLSKFVVLLSSLLLIIIQSEWYSRNSRRMCADLNSAKYLQDKLILHLKWTIKDDFFCVCQKHWCFSLSSAAKKMFNMPVNNSEHFAPYYTGKYSHALYIHYSCFKRGFIQRSGANWMQTASSDEGVLAVVFCVRFIHCNGSYTNAGAGPVRSFLRLRGLHANILHSLFTCTYIYSQRKSCQQLTLESERKSGHNFMHLDCMFTAPIKRQGSSV